jgi:predicted MPP superfamily phosphohydrolase
MIPRFFTDLVDAGFFRWLAVFAVVAAAVFVVHSYLETRRLHVVYDELRSEQLPRTFDGTRVVFVADIHAGPFFRAGRVRDLVDRINALEPDVLLLGGDYVGGRSTGAELFYPEAKRLDANLGTFAVLGNHDVWEGEAVARRGLSEAGITLLQNDSIRIEKGDDVIHIAGLDDLYTGTPDTVKAAAGIEEGDYAMLLSHNPDAFSRGIPETSGTWDLALAGHTHGGQVTAFGMSAPVMASINGQRYRSGWMDEAGTPVLVTHGIGTVTAPLRFFARPEIHVVTLRSDEPLH